MCLEPKIQQFRDPAFLTLALQLEFQAPKASDVGPSKSTSFIFIWGCSESFLQLVLTRSPKRAAMVTGQIGLFSDTQTSNPGSTGSVP